MSVSIGTSTESYTNYNTSKTKTSAVKNRANTNSSQATGDTKAAETTTSEAAVYEKTEEPKQSTYSIHRMSEEERNALVEKLKLDQEARINQLSELVRKMFQQQGDTSELTNLADLFSEENLKKVTPEEIAQAKEDVSEDGYWGVKQTSQRMFDFACALAGDDVDKMKEMQEAMKKGYAQAEKAWGNELPEICKNTLDAADKLFDEYYKSKEVTE